MSTGISSPSGRAQAPGSTAQVWCPTVQTHQQSVYTQPKHVYTRRGSFSKCLFCIRVLCQGIRCRKGEVGDSHASQLQQQPGGKRAPASMQASGQALSTSTGAHKDVLKAA